MSGDHLATLDALPPPEEGCRHASAPVRLLERVPRPDLA
jgi:hypothetical protein